MSLPLVNRPSACLQITLTCRRTVSIVNAIQQKETVMSANQALMQRDLSVLWHPCTQMKDHEQLPLIPIRRGEGVWLEDFEGNRYLDAVSSWWVNLFGHANPRINAAVHDQLVRLVHFIHARFSHEPAVALA